MNDKTEKYLPHDSIQYLDKKKYVNIWGDKLPHWFQENKTVFATFRLADSLPQEKKNELLDELLKMREEIKRTGIIEARENHNWRIMQKMEQWLNNGFGGCCLSDPTIRKIVEDAIHYYDGKLYILHSFVVMPNHVHVLLSPLGIMPIVDSLGKVKSYTANIINKKLNRIGKLWQHGIFDRIIRNAEDFTAKWNYIIQNPRNLSKETYTLYIRQKENM